MKRRHELICLNEFQRILASTYPGTLFSWDEPPQDPPDWYLTTGDKRFAVEATSIVEELELGTSSVPSPSASMALKEFVDGIELAAADRGILTGAYLVSLCPIPNLSQHKESLQAQLIRYISDTKDVAAAPERPLGRIGHHELTIAKMHDEACYVAEMISFGVKSGSEAQADLAEYIADALAAKTHKLRNVTDPIILLILDDYQYSHISDWRLAVAGAPGKASFRCIVRVSPSDRSEVIWPESDWLAYATGPAA